MPEGGGRAPRNVSFSAWVSFGVPWGAPGHQKEPKDAKLLPRDPKSYVLTTETEPKMHTSFVDF
jgi:hypothetical protein